MYLLRTTRLGRRRCYIVQVCWDSSFGSVSFIYIGIISFPDLGLTLCLLNWDLMEQCLLFLLFWLKMVGFAYFLDFLCFSSGFCLFCTLCVCVCCDLELLEMLAGYTYLGELLISRVNFRYLVSLFSWKLTSLLGSLLLIFHGLDRSEVGHSDLGLNGRERLMWCETVKLGLVSIWKLVLWKFL